MLESILFPQEYNLKIESISLERQVIVIIVSSSNQEVICPCCQRTSHRVHSCYQRQPADLPIAAHFVRRLISVRRFFCDNSDCERRIFAERMPALLQPYARCTNRLIVHLRHVAFALGGEAGARLLRTQGILVRPDTLLRIIRNANEAEVKTPRVLGIDDCAKKKGNSYGTILVDLESRKPVALLPDRKATSIEEWLKAHPGVEVISRDRGTEYIKGATAGAPHAIQVADRWHLLKNIRESLPRLLEAKPDCLKAAAESNQDQQSMTEDQEAIDGQPSKTETMPAMTNEQQTHIKSTDAPSEIVEDDIQLGESKELTQAEKVQLQRPERRLQRYTLVKKLKLQGFSLREISRRTKMSRQTVTKYARNNRRLRLTVKANSCPQYPKGVQRKSKLQPYKDYITQRLKDGHKGTKIFQELRLKGFSGAYSTVAKWIRKEKNGLPGGAKPPPEVVSYSSRRASWLLVKQPEERDDDESLSLQRMLQASDTVACAHTLGQRFGKIIRERDSEALRAWLKDAADSGIDTLKQFATGIKQDYDAVTNALSYEWSQGQVEGQVNRLKLIKRQMYGRANFDLLRKRALFHPI